MDNRFLLAGTVCGFALMIIGFISYVANPAATGIVVFIIGAVAMGGAYLIQHREARTIIAELETIYARRELEEVLADDSGEATAEEPEAGRAE